MMTQREHKIESHEAVLVKIKKWVSSYIKDVDLRVQTWENVHFRLMYQEKLIQGSCLRRPPEANELY